MINNFQIQSISREEELVIVSYIYTKPFDGGTDENGESRGMIDREFEAQTTYIDPHITNDKLPSPSDEEITTQLKSELNI